MTVCIAVKVHDCIVFAADSAVSTTTTTSDGTSVVANVWRHGLKVFNLHRELPIVAMTAGLANFGAMSITNLAKDLRKKLTEDLCVTTYTINEVVEHAYLYFQNEYQNVHLTPISDHSFEFWIGGYSHDNKQGEIWKFEMRNAEWPAPVQLASPETSNYVSWGGQVQAVSRLLLGCDPQLYQVLQAQILNANQLEQVKYELLNVQTPLVDPSMPVQDAIDLAEFLVELTTKYFAFLPGADVVAGDTDIATVTKHEGFKWIRRKHYYSPRFNRREIDHVT